MNDTKYYVDVNGNYIGGFEGLGAESLVPEGAIEVPFAPSDARQIWNDVNYDQLPPE